MKITPEMGDAWPVSLDRAPRAGTVLSGLESFWRLLEAAVELGRSSEGGAGFSFALEEKRESVVSAEAERMRLEGP